MISKTMPEARAFPQTMRQQAHFRPLFLIFCFFTSINSRPEGAIAQSSSISTESGNLRDQVISLSARHRRAEALVLIDHYKLTHKSDPGFYVEVAVAFQAGRDFVEAIKIVSEGLQKHPNNFDLLLTEARIWLDVGEAEKAEADLLLCAKLKPHWTGLHSEMARVFSSRGDFNRALGESSDAVTLEPRSFEAWKIHSRILANMGRYKEAGAAIDKSIEILAHYPPGQIALKRDQAPIREKLGQYQGAIDDYLVFLKADDYKNPRALVKVGEGYMQLKQPQKALPYFDMALRRNQSLMEAHRGKLAALEALHQTEAAARERKSLHETEEDFTPLK
jgi:tetratricopeptide (TPR) repeat protein